MDGDSESSASPSPIEPHSRRSSSEIPRKRRSKDGPSILGGSMRDVARVLVSRERETMDLKRTLYTITEQLKAERQRADAAEHKTREVLALFKNANEAKMAAEQEAARANEALRLYKLQYENAQQEIRRAQKLIDALDTQRVDAEETAAKARSLARKMKEEAIVVSAREAGRRQGLEEGLAQGRMIGYEQGRSVGYEDGRADTERAYTAGAMTEPYAEETPRQEYRAPRVSRPSSSEDSVPNTTQNYTQPLDDTLPIPPPVATPARIPTPAAAPVRLRQEQMHQEADIRPVSVFNPMMSPSHPPVEVPPDGWIPKLDDDMRIRLPPPHEMGPPPPTSPSPPLSAVLNNVRNIEEPPPVTIPPPVSGGYSMRMPEGDHSSAPRRPRHRRRNSDESQSTTMSQFEILGPPSTVATHRSTARERAPVLSAIQEERERSSSVSSPVYGMPNMSTQSFQMPSPAPQMPSPRPNVPMPSPQQPPPNPTYPAISPHRPPSNPPYPTPESMGRYRSTDSLARSSTQDHRYAVPELRSRSSASTTDDAHRYGSTDNYYRSRPDDRTPRNPTTESLYRPAPPDATPRYERPDSRARSDRTDPPRNVYPDSASRSGSVRGYPSRDNLTRSGSRSDLGRGPSVDNSSRVQNIYAPPRSPHSSPDSPAIPVVAPQPSLRPPAPEPASNRGSMSSNEINFTIVPPSRPESNISRQDMEAMQGVFLSADDADRPLPPLPSDGAPDTSGGQPTAPTNPVIPPPVMLSGPWPPQGFIPTGPPSPAQPGGTSSIYGGSTIGPAGVPLPPSTIGGTPSVRSEVPIPGSFPAGMEGPTPVIPIQLSTRSSQSGSSRRAAEPYSRSKVSRRDDDTDSVVSSSLGSSDSLTTPPVRTRKLSGRSTPSYAAAPNPSGVAYPVPPTPRSAANSSLGSHSNRAARVPLPPSVAGSAVGSARSPSESTVGYGTAPTLNHRSSIVGRERTLSEIDYETRSPIIRGAGGRYLSSPSQYTTGLPSAEPVIPIPIPEPAPPLPVQIIPMPSSPIISMDHLSGFDPVPIVPDVARAPSPGASALSGTTNATAKEKGGKKTKKKGGKGK